MIISAPTAALAAKPAVKPDLMLSPAIAASLPEWGRLRKRARRRETKRSKVFRAAILR
jgi:hypothetical protein